MDERLPDMLDQCLERLAGGATVDECLVIYPPQQAELELPLRMAAQLRDLPRPAMPASTRTRLEAQMLELAARRAASSTTAAPSPPAARRWFSPEAILTSLLATFGYRGSLAKPWLRLAAAAGAIVLAIALGAGALAAARTIVDAIRPQPTTMPTATQLPTPSPRAALTLNGRIEQMAQERWLVGGTTVVLSSTTRIAGAPAIGALAHIQGSGLGNGAVLANSIAVETPAPTPTSTPTTIPTQRIAPTQPAQPSATPIPAPGPAATAVPPQPPHSTGGQPDDQNHTCNGQQRGRDEKKCDPKPHEDKKPGKPRKK
jgi:hypothetical protein